MYHTCIMIAARASPLETRRPTCLGKRDAKITTTAVMIGRSCPCRPNAFAPITLAAQMHAASANDKLAVEK